MMAQQYGELMYNSDYASIAGLGIIALLVYLAITIGLVILSVWITYTIIWRAVRRGLREFYQPGSQNRPLN